jgi:hypothetical protein
MPEKHKNNDRPLRLAVCNRYAACDPNSEHNEGENGNARDDHSASTEFFDRKKASKAAKDVEGDQNGVHSERLIDADEGKEVGYIYVNMNLNKSVHASVNAAPMNIWAAGGIIAISVRRFINKISTNFTRFTPRKTWQNPGLLAATVFINFSLSWKLVSILFNSISIKSGSRTP